MTSYRQRSGHGPIIHGAGTKPGQWYVHECVFGLFGQLDGTTGAILGTDEALVEYTLELDQIRKLGLKKFLN